VDILTLGLLDRLVKQLDMTRIGVVRKIVKLAIDQKISIQSVANFRDKTWKAVMAENEPNAGTLAFDWTKEELGLLHAYAKRLFGNKNCSAALRILVAYFAVNENLAMIVPSDSLTVRQAPPPCPSCGATYNELDLMERHNRLAVQCPKCDFRGPDVPHGTPGELIKMTAWALWKSKVVEMEAEAEAEAAAVKR
jgi:hypothetical protein